MLLTHTQAPTRASRRSGGRARLALDPVAVLAHEIKTPISALIGLAGVLLVPLGDETLSPQQRAIAEQILLAGQQLRALVTDLLELTAARHGWLPLDPAPLDARRLAVEQAERLAPLAAAKGQRLEVWADPAAPLALADAERVRQIVGNLVANAIAYTGEAGEIAIFVRGDQPGTVAIGVVDNGPGISPDEIATIFAPPEERVTRRARGLGLGLALVRALAEAHGGHAYAASAPGAGSVVWISLPAASAEPAGIALA